MNILEMTKIASCLICIHNSMSIALMILGIVNILQFTYTLFVHDRITILSRTIGLQGCRMWDVVCRMSDVGCRMSDVGCRMLDVGCRMSDVPFFFTRWDNF